MYTVINRLHKFFNQVDNFVLTGFLGQIPNDIWSTYYTAWLRQAGAHIGQNSKVHYRVKVWNPENIYIGANVKIPATTDMAGMAEITIGDNVLIGANVSFITNHHPLNATKLRREEVLRGTQQPIIVRDNVWIMNRASLCAGRHGLTIGESAWIAQGAVVTKDVPENELWGGIPAVKILTIESY